MKKLTGFSLIELLVVITIVGVIAAIAAPVYQRYTQRAKAAQLYKAIAPYLDQYMVKTNSPQGWTGWSSGLDGPQAFSQPFFSSVFMGPTVVSFTLNPGYFNREATTYIIYYPTFDGAAVQIDFSESEVFTRMNAAETISWTCAISGPPGQYYGGYDVEEFRQVYFPDCL